MKTLAQMVIKSHVNDQGNDQKPQKEHNIFEMILSNDNLPPREKAFDRISHEGVVLVAAGGETTARALTIATFFILTHKDTVLPRLDEEIRQVMPTESSRPPVKALERLPWLVSLRLSSLLISIDGTCIDTS